MLQQVTLHSATVINILSDRHKKKLINYNKIIINDL